MFAYSVRLNQIKRPIARKYHQIRITLFFSMRLSSLFLAGGLVKAPCVSCFVYSRLLFIWKQKNIPVNKLKQHATKNSSYTTLPATNSHIAPETECLEDYFPFGTALFSGQIVSFIRRVHFPAQNLHQVQSQRISCVEIPAALAAIAPATWRWKELYDQVVPGSNSKGACLTNCHTGYILGRITYPLSETVVVKMMFVLTRWYMFPGGYFINSITYDTGSNNHAKSMWRLAANCGPIHWSYWFADDFGTPFKSFPS